MDSGYADIERDTLAILAAALAGDGEGVGLVAANCDMFNVIGVLAYKLTRVLLEHGTDPAEWVAAQQARVREELGSAGA